MTTFRKRKCRGCQEWFKPTREGQIACAPLCALAVVAIQREQDAARETRAAKEQLKSRGDLAKEAQKAFNQFIRERDDGLPCISCGIQYGLFQAGHYLTVGARPDRRYDMRNCHAQCAQCNHHKSGNIAGYRPALEQKIGRARLDALERDDGPRKYTKDDLRRIREIFQRKTKHTKRLRALLQARECLSNSF